MRGFRQLIYKYFFGVYEKILKLLKIKNNKIVVDNFFGNGYGCNPKYIVEKLLKNTYNLDIVWLVKDKNDESIPLGVRKIIYGSFQAAYELATAKIWIDNIRNGYKPSKKKQQFYIQTWHGDFALKKIEGEVESELSLQYINAVKKDSAYTDVILSGCKDFTEKVKNFFWYDGLVLECGTPRMDILINGSDDIFFKVYRELKINKNKKIVLYVPTFRSCETIDIFKFEYEKCLQYLKERFDYEYIMLIRLHPNFQKFSEQLSYNDNVINATQYPDIQELLCVSDVLITDFSSCIMEFALTHKAAFIFVKDRKDYLENNRSLSYSLEELPFSIAENEEDLWQNILNFDFSQYKKNCSDFFQKLGNFENGNASSIVANMILKEMKLLSD